MVLKKRKQDNDADLELLIVDGNIGFFRSCEITQMFLISKSDKALINLYILASFEEKPFIEEDHQFLCRPIAIDKNFDVGIQRYKMSINTAKATFHKLATENKWAFRNNESLKMEKLVKLSKQFVPGNEGQRLSRVLKNNFHNGSYVIEFFDESKKLTECLSTLDHLHLLNKVSEKIKKVVPIDLSVVRDRIGNIIFQFPVTIINLASKARPDWDGLILKFKWHNRLTVKKTYLIQVDSTMDKNYMGAAMVPYEGKDEQEIIIGNINQVSHVKVWSESPNLLLSVFDGTYLRRFGLNTSIGSDEPRIFKIGGEEQIVSISSKGLKSGVGNIVDYATFIANNLYEAEKESLEKSLSFKQYFKDSAIEALNDLRILINNNDANGVALWDPYLRANDILNTLYFSPTAGVELRAIGAIDASTKKVYDQKGVSPALIIAGEKKILDDTQHNNYGLNLEFRMQYESYGWAFHDRFLIFSGSKERQAKVYSVGTSINSIGNSHHILQEVSHPQRVVDAFNELWNKLNNKDCLVWKSR